MKCNEARPHCANCLKSSLECVWPSLNLSLLPHGSDFKVRRTPKKIGRDFIFYEQPKLGANADGNTENGETHNATNPPSAATQRGVHVANSLDSSGSLVPYSNDVYGEYGTTEYANYTSGFPNGMTNGLTNGLNSTFLVQHPRVSELIDIKLELPLSSFSYLSDSQTLPYDEDPIVTEIDQNFSLGLTPLSGSATWMPGTEFSLEDSQFFHAFVHGFLPAISPQNCHPQIAPVAIFLPQGTAEPIMREVFYACGAAFMSGVNPELRHVSKRRYIACVNRFNRRLAENGGRIEEWMVAAALLFTLRDKFTGSSPDLPASHLATAIQLIRILRAQHGDQSVIIKFFVESFLFNYSMVLITADALVRKLLPSPFDIFEEWRPAFEYKPFRCYVPWQNNPVFGAATQAFELAAKASWLVQKCPLSDDDMAIACDLLSETYRMKSPEIDIQPGDQIPPHDYVQLQESVAVSNVSKYACQLLLLRMMNPGIELEHTIIRDRVLGLLEIYKTISLDNPIWATCAWLLLVTGLSAVDPYDRQFILLMCYRNAKMCHAAFMGLIALVMELAWGTDKCPGEGWNLLFNTGAVKSICL